MLLVDDSRIVLNNIEIQAEKLHLKSVDIAALSDILHVTYINNFKKIKTPKFNDIYRISLAIGMPLEHLLCSDSVKAEDDSRNIIHWFKNDLDAIHPTSFLCAIPDKIALADFIGSMYEIDEFRADFIRKILLLQEADLLFLYNVISSRMPYISGDKALYTEHDNLYDIWQDMRCLYRSVWDPKTKITHLFWKTASSRILDVFPSITRFYRASGVSTKTYAEYEDMNGITSPTTETMMKVAGLLSIEDIDAAIRDHIEEQSTPENLFRSTEDHKKIPYEITYSEVRKHLRTMPELGIFMDQILTLNDLDLKYMDDLASHMIKHPFSSYYHTIS